MWSLHCEVGNDRMIAPEPRLLRDYPSVPPTYPAGHPIVIIKYGFSLQIVSNDCNLVPKFESTSLCQIL